MSTQVVGKQIDYKKLLRLIIAEIIDTEVSWQDILRRFEEAEKVLIEKDKDHYWVRSNRKWYVRSKDTFKRRDNIIPWRTPNAESAKVNYQKLLRVIIEEIIDTDVAWEDVILRLDVLGQRLVEVDNDHYWVKYEKEWYVRRSKSFNDLEVIVTRFGRVALAGKFTVGRYTFRYSKRFLTLMDPKDASEIILKYLSEVPPVFKDIVFDWYLFHPSDSGTSQYVGVYYVGLNAIALVPSTLLAIKNHGNTSTLIHELAHAYDYKKDLADKIVAAGLRDAAINLNRQLFRGNVHGPDFLAESIAEAITTIIYSPKNFGAFQLTEDHRKFLRFLAKEIKVPVSV